MRALRWGLLVAVAVAVLVGALRYPAIARLTDIGAGYAALQLCACVEVSRRPLEACKLDNPPDMARVEVAQVREGERIGVRARIPLLADRTAWHRPPDGCVLEGR